MRFTLILTFFILALGRLKAESVYSSKIIKTLKMTVDQMPQETFERLLETIVTCHEYGSVSSMNRNIIASDFSEKSELGRIVLSQLQLGFGHRLVSIKVKKSNDKSRLEIFGDNLWVSAVKEYANGEESCYIL